MNENWDNFLKEINILINDILYCKSYKKVVFRLHVIR